MKTLTIKQPWATLIRDKDKKYEFRTWKTNYRGPLLIHAGMGIDKESMELFHFMNKDYPSKEIICEVELINCIKVDEEFLKKLSKENKLVYQGVKIGEYAWEIKFIKELSIPNVKGKLGLWNYGGDIDVK